MQVVVSHILVTKLQKTFHTAKARHPGGSRFCQFVHFLLICPLLIIYIQTSLTIIQPGNRRWNGT